MLFGAIKNPIFAYNFDIPMRKIVGFFVLLFSLNACDDGDFTIESFDFTSATTNSCNSGESGFFIYKINDNEALILQIPETNFENEITPTGVPRTLSINSTNKVIYRLYNGDLNTNVICNTIPPANPTVTKEWNALSGNIEISTSVNKEVDETTNASEITGYTHSIVLRNVNFDTGNGNQQLFTELVFGDYVTSSLRQGDFDVNIAQCGSDNSFLFKIPVIGSSTPANVPPQAMTLRIDPNLFVAEVTPENQPRTALINGTSNFLQLVYYNDIIGSEFLCASETPTYPIPIEEFNAENGVTDVSGIIEVTTTIEYEIPTDNQSPVIGHRHKIILKNVTMTKVSSPELQISFNLGNVYEFGEFVILL
ncbi:hypothetical protein [Flavobacterium piscinae]|nr:hypothetical protein [Flavobacterium piscinae]